MFALSRVVGLVRNVVLAVFGDGKPPPRPDPTRTRLGLHPLEPREVPAVVNYVVNTEFDAPDATPADNAPIDTMGRTSLRSVIEHINSLATPNADGYRIDFANVTGAPFLSKQGGVVYPNGGTLMTVSLSSQLPTIGANCIISIYGSTTRRVTITRDSAALPNNTFRFLDVAAGGELTLNGLKLTSAKNEDGLGGAARNLGTMEVINCEFRDNVGGDGGAIFNEGQLVVNGGQPLNQPTAAPLVSLFSDNHAVGGGGAIESTGNASASVDVWDTQFVSNDTGFGFELRTGHGGAIDVEQGTLTVDRSSFVANRANLGGAIYSSVGVQATPSVVVGTTDFSCNSAENDGYGGAAYLKNTNSKFTSCSFGFEFAAAEGGAIVLDKGELALQTCQFHANSAGGEVGCTDVEIVGPAANAGVFNKDNDTECTSGLFEF